MTPEAKLKAAAKRYAQSRAARDAAIREASAAGLSERKIADAVDLSHQRVHQIIQGQ